MYRIAEQTAVIASETLALLFPPASCLLPPASTTRLIQQILIMSTIKPSFDRAYQDFLQEIKTQVMQSRIEAARHYYLEATARLGWTRNGTMETYH